MENFEILLEQIAQLCEKGEISALRELLCELNVVDIALLIEELEPKDRLRAFRILPKDVSAEAFAYLESDDQSVLKRNLSFTGLPAIMSCLSQIKSVPDTEQSMYIKLLIKLTSGIF